MSVNQGAANEIAMDRNGKCIFTMSSDCQKPFKSVPECLRHAYLNLEVKIAIANIQMLREWTNLSCKCDRMSPLVP